MAAYQIKNLISGKVIGAWEADSAMDAMDVMAVDLGYDSYLALCDAVPPQPRKIMVTELDTGAISTGG